MSSIAIEISVETENNWPRVATGPRGWDGRGARDRGHLAHNSVRDRSHGALAVMLATDLRQCTMLCTV